MFLIGIHVLKGGCNYLNLLLVRILPLGNWAASMSGLLSQPDPNAPVSAFRSTCTF